MSDCPKCHLPIEEGAWQCDGCGYAFSQDVDATRAALQARVKDGRVMLWVTLGVGLGVVGGLAYLATIGFIYVSVGLLIAVVGWIGHAVHSLSVSREHLQSFNRRHAR
jgi:hypothetical protein